MEGTISNRSSVNNTPEEMNAIMVEFASNTEKVWKFNEQASQEAHSMVTVMQQLRKVALEIGQVTVPRSA